MNDWKCKWNINLRKIFYITLLLFYSLLSVFLMNFTRLVNEKGNPNVYGYIYIVFLFSFALFSGEYLLIKICRNLNEVDQSKQSLKLGLYRSMWTLCIEICFIEAFILHMIIYLNSMKNLESLLQTAILWFILIVFLVLCGINLIFYKNQIIVVVLVYVLAFIAAVLLGVLTLTDFSIEAGVFFIGLLYTVIENIGIFIKPDREMDTLENDKRSKNNKVVLCLIIGIFFMILYITFKVLSFQPLQKWIINFLGFNTMSEWLAIGLLRLISTILLILLYLFLGTLVLNRKEKQEAKGYDNKLDSRDEIERRNYMIFIELRNKVLPEVVEEIAIGEEIIDSINPEVFITNKRELPKDTYIILSEENENPTIRNLIIIYPNKEVYRCKFKIGKNTVTRVADVEKVNCVENNVTD